MTSSCYVGNGPQTSPSKKKRTIMGQQHKGSSTQRSTKHTGPNTSLVIPGFHGNASRLGRLASPQHQPLREAGEKRNACNEAASFISQLCSGSVKTDGTDPLHANAAAIKSEMCTDFFFFGAYSSSVGC